MLHGIGKSGVNGLQAMDPVMDVQLVKRFFEGRITACGNFNCGLMPTGRPEAFYNKTKSLIFSCKEGDRFILKIQTQ